MHISEGILSAQVLLAGMGAGAAGVAAGLRNLSEDQIPEVAIVSAALFVASLIHLPLGPSSVHLILNGIAGILLGWKVFPALLIALFMQAVLFQHGGLTVLGINLINVALPAVLVGYLFRRIFRNRDADVGIWGIAAALAGGLAVLLTALMVVLTLVISDASAFSEVAGVIFISHLPVVILEGILSGAVVVFLLKVKPEMLTQKRVSHLS